MLSMVDIFNEMTKTARLSAKIADLDRRVQEHNQLLMTCTPNEIRKPYDLEPIPKLRSSIPTNCPNCAAPIDIHAEQCAYCDTPYTYLSRPRYGREPSEGVKIEIDTSAFGVSVKEAVENIKRMQEHALKFEYNL